MNQGDGYESSEVREHLIYRRPSSTTTEYRQYNPNTRPIPESYQPDVIESYPPQQGEAPQSQEHLNTYDSSQTTLRQDPYAYQRYVPVPSEPRLEHDLDAGSSNPYGFMIQPAWRRHLMAWITAFLTICFFVFTIIFARNATQGENADIRLLFNNPGRDILVLQVLSTVSTTLLGELLISTCEMVFFI
jgi:hypothetical protein